MSTRSRSRCVRALAFAGAAALSACGTAGPMQAERVCDASTLGWAIGQPFDDALYQRLLRDSGAGLLNPIAPSTSVRADSRRDRLRVYLDKDNRVTAARCE